MSIAKDPGFNAALTDIAIGTHKHLPNDEIFLIAAVDAYICYLSGVQLYAHRLVTP
jgi:hypothetical protein